MSFTGIPVIDFIPNACVHLLNVIGLSTGLGFWPATAFVLCVAWPAASFVLLQTVFREKKETNAPRCVS